MILGAGAAACRGGAPAPVAYATVARPQLDTVRFEAPAVVRRCTAGRGILFEAVGDGNGLLVWLRGVDTSAGGDYDILGVRDTVTPRGAIVSARYMTGDLAHGFSLDSGSVSVSESGGRLGARIGGAGLEIPGAIRPIITVDFVALPPLADSAPCEPQR